MCNYSINRISKYGDIFITKLISYFNQFYVLIPYNLLYHLITMLGLLKILSINLSLPYSIFKMRVN